VAHDQREQLAARVTVRVRSVYAKKQGTGSGTHKENRPWIQFWPQPRPARCSPLCEPGPSRVPGRHPHPGPRASRRSGRWPGFTQASADSGLSAAFAFPLLIPGRLRGHAFARNESVVRTAHAVLARQSTVEDH